MLVSFAGFAIMIMIVAMEMYRMRVPIAVSHATLQSESHQMKWLVLVSRPCPDGKFKCASGHCISNTSRCDGYPQCADISDEAGCPPRFPNGQYCPADRFTCNNTLCIHQSWICDGGNALVSLSLSRLNTDFYFFIHQDNDCRDNR